MGDRIDNLMMTVDLLRRRVQQQEQTITEQAKIIEAQRLEIGWIGCQRRTYQHFRAAQKRALER
jgi:hypothetical protein